MKSLRKSKMTIKIPRAQLDLSTKCDVRIRPERLKISKKKSKFLNKALINSAKHHKVSTDKN